MSAARQAAIAAIDTQILNRQTSNAVYGPGIEEVETKGPATKQFADVTAATKIDPGEPTIKMPGAFKYGAGEAPPPPKSSQGAAAELARRQAQQASASQQARAQALRVYDQTARTIRSLNTSTRGNLSNANRFLSNIPSPGGVWVPFWILIFLFMVLIPVKGNSRIKWLWLVIIGHARISGEPADLGGTLTPTSSGNNGVWSGILAGIGGITGLSSNTSTNTPAPPAPLPTYSSVGGLLEVTNAGNLIQIPGNNYIVSINSTGEGT